MNILLISTQDYIHHPIPSRHHYIFEELSKKHKIHVAHFHVSRGVARDTNLIVENATLFPIKSPLPHYIINAPYHFYKFDKIIKENNIDIVIGAHVLAGSAMIHAARKNDIPVLFDLKDWFPDSAAAYFKNKTLQDVVRKSVLEITKYNLKNSDLVTTVSPSLASKIKSLGVYSKVITNGVDTDIFKQVVPKNEWKQSIGISNDDFVIGFVGSIEKWYDISGLITSMPEILKHNPKTKLLIVGSSLFTKYGKEMELLVKNLKLNDNVIFTGVQPYKDLPKYISLMDICTIPLIPDQWRDIALPNKFFEYTACKKPILSTPIPDMEAISQGNVFIYKNKQEYIDKIKYLMKNKFQFSIDVSKLDWKNRANDFDKIIQLLTS